MKRDHQIELFFLISLIDFREPVKPNTVFTHIRNLEYMRWEPDLRDNPSLISSLHSSDHINTKENGKIEITKSGRKHLRLLCGQVNESDAAANGHTRIKHFRNLYDSDIEAKKRAREIRHIDSNEKSGLPKLELERELEEAGEIYPYDILAQALLSRSQTGDRSVYVVKLKNAIREKRTPLHRGQPDMPCVYVGLTGLSPEERLENHKRDHKASRHVRDYGIGLMPELYDQYNRLPWRLADQVEPALAKKLHRLGYNVFGGH